VGFLNRLWSRLASAIVAPERPVNAVTVAVPFNTGRPREAEFDTRLLVDQGYRRNVIVFACIGEIAESSSEPEILSRDKHTKETLPDTHPLVTLWERPNPTTPRFALLEQLLKDLLSSGEAYLHKGRNASGIVIQLQRLRPDRIKPIPDALGNVVAYEYNVDGMNRQIIPRADVAPVILPDPLNDYRGLPPLAVAAVFADMDAGAAQYLRDYFINGAMPGGFFTIKTGPIDRVERERIMAEAAETFGRGTGNVSGWHRFGVLGGDVDWKEVSGTPDKLRLDGVWGMSESRICAAFKVPPQLIQARIGMQFSTYANYEQAVRSFWSETLAPMYRRLSEVFTFEIAIEFGEGLETVFDLEHVSALQESEDAKSDRLLKQYAGGVLRLSEVREKIGADPLEFDYLVKPSGALELDEDGLPIAPAVPPALAPFTGMDPDEPPDPDSPEEVPPKKPGPGSPEPEDDDVEQPKPDESRRLLRVVHGQKSKKGPALRVAYAKYAKAAEKVAGILEAFRASVDARSIEAALGRETKKAAARAVEELVPWSTIERSLQAELGALLSDVVAAAGAAVYRTKEKHEAFREGMAFRTASPAVVKWIEKHVAKEVGRTIREGRTAIREAVLARLEGKISHAQAAREIKESLALNRVQTAAVNRFARNLERQGLDPDRIFTRASKYANKLLAQRADLIAWQETATAAAEAQRLAWDQMREDGLISRRTLKQWRVTSEAERTCPICEDLDGETAELDDAFEGIDGGSYMRPPEPHPGCECELDLVEDEAAGLRPVRAGGEKA
jgi:HK97 family phage portal protein